MSISVEVSALAGEAGATAKLARDVAAAAADAHKDPTLGHLRALRAAIAKAGPKLTALADQGAALDPRIAEAAAPLEQAQKWEFARLLQAAFEPLGVTPRKEGDAPVTYRLAPLTLVVDFRADTAQLRYAQCELPGGATSTRAADIAAAWRACKAALDKGSVAADVLAPALDRAYRGLVAKRRAAFGDRVDLVELHRELAAELRPNALTVASKVVKPYTKAMFAWDLARLQSQLRMQVGGCRAVLTVATAGSAYKEDRVVFVDDGAGGQKYLSFHLIAG